MRKITFEWQYGHGEHNTTREIVEFEDSATTEEIQEDFERWVWEQIGDDFTWHES
jgi:hypothetical protein